jgi:hypothetical protein
MAGPSAAAQDDAGRPGERAGRRGRGPVLVALALVVAAALAGALLVVTGSGDGRDGVVLEPAGRRGSGSFFDEELDLELAEADPGGDPPADEVDGVEPLDGDAPVALAGLTVRGNQPGLYGARRGEPTCDVDRLDELLSDEDGADTADAWFGALERNVGHRPAYLSDLTPVRLRFDTRVTGHRLEGDTATSFPSVLQAGTAVLVDKRGIPRVRCAGGTPLSEPGPAPEGTSADDALDVGAQADDPDAAWDGFDPASVLVVTGHGVVHSFELADLAGGGPFRRPTGSDGGRDQDPPDQGAGAPERCQDCPDMRMAVTSTSGSALHVEQAAGPNATSVDGTELTWLLGRAEPGTYGLTLSRRYEILRPYQDGDPVILDNPDHEDETIVLDTAGTATNGVPAWMQCVPGDATVTVTVSDEVAETAELTVPCDQVTAYEFTLG